MCDPMHSNGSKWVSWTVPSIVTMFQFEIRDKRRNDDSEGAVLTMMMMKFMITMLLRMVMIMSNEHI